MNIRILPIAPLLLGIGATAAGGACPRPPIVTPESFACSPTREIVETVKFDPFATEGPSGWLTLWAGYRDEYDKYAQIFANRISALGRPLDAGGWIPIATNSPVTGPVAVWSGTSYFVAWSQFMYGNSWDIFGMRVSREGYPLDPAPIPLVTGPDLELALDLVWNGQEVLLVYEASPVPDPPGLSRVYAQRLSPNGELIDGFHALPISGNGQQDIGAAVWTGASYLLVWYETPSPDSLVSDVFAVALSALAEPLSDPIRISAAPIWSGETLDIAWSRISAMVVFHRTNTIASSGEGEFGVILDALGRELAPEFRISDASIFADSPAVAWMGESFFVAWFQHEESNPIRGAFGRRFDEAGRPLDTQALPLTPPDGAQFQLALASGSNGALLVWQSGADGDWYHSTVFSRAIDSSGEPSGSSIEPLSTTIAEQVRPAVASVGGAAHATMWKDLRAGNGEYPIEVEISKGDDSPSLTLELASSDYVQYFYGGTAAGTYGLVWSPYNHSLEGQFVSQKGIPAPIALPRSSDWTWAFPLTIISGAEKMFVVFQTVDLRDQTFTIRGAAVAPGEPAGEAVVLAPPSAVDGFEGLQVVPSTPGYTLIWFQKDDYDQQRVVISNYSRALGPSAPFDASGFSWWKRHLRSVTNGVFGLHVWEELVSDGMAVMALVTSSIGIPLGPPQRLISGGIPSVAVVGGSFVLAWSDGSSTDNKQFQVAWLDVDPVGRVRAGEPLSTPVAAYYDPVLTAAGEDALRVTYSTTDEAPPFHGVPHIVERTIILPDHCLAN